MSGWLLAGPPGVGKTTVARLVAHRLGRQYVDLDELIEARCRRSPADILEQDGEDRFRALEHEALEALGSAGVVISLGGGALTSARTRLAARRIGPIIRLDADREVLARRLEDAPGSRPLLDRGLDALLDARRHSYAAVDVIVDGRGPPEEVAPRVEAAAEHLSVIRSRLVEHETRILIGRRLEAAVTGAVAHLEPTRPVILIRDGGVPTAVRERIETNLRELYPVHAVDVPGGEGAKQWSVLGELLDGALRAGGGRQSAVVGVGGGAVCDVANLAAHLLGRGAPSILVPTTLLAQVDASVGGKCAVNHADQRNPLGAFNAPAEVIIDLDLLESLAPEEFRSGLAELVKMAIIGMPDVFAQLEAAAAEAPGRLPRVDPIMVAKAVELKSRVVARDPLEHGERKHLNLGHTLGHALEAASGFQMRHGEGVALGLAATARASERRGIAVKGWADRVERLLEALGLPVHADRALLERARAHLVADKKGDAIAVDWIAMRDLGEVVIERLPWQEIESTLVELGG